MESTAAVAGVGMMFALAADIAVVAHSARFVSAFTMSASEPRAA